ncbi:MAG: hypothetical protein Q7K54_05740 [Candidatus Parcubacteria bacterium]|nr:hypothetical protein [Candidatus Parcubacteria bacterium]
MIKEIKKTTGKYVTEKTFNAFENRFDKFENRFDSSARAVAKSFANNTEVMGLILKEIRAIHEGNKYFRQSISSLNTDGFSYDKRISGLDMRVEKLETKSE